MLAGRPDDANCAHGQSARPVWDRHTVARMPIDLLLRNAALAGRDGLVDLEIDGGRFVGVGRSRDVTARRTIDAEARLVTPPLVDCHLHLDASLTAGRPRFNESGTLIEGIHLWGELKGDLTVEDVQARAREVVRWTVDDLRNPESLRRRVEAAAARGGPARVSARFAVPTRLGPV